VYEETPAGQPHDTSEQKATRGNENVDAVLRHALDITRCGCRLTSCPVSVWLAQLVKALAALTHVRSCVQEVRVRSPEWTSSTLASIPPG